MDVRSKPLLLVALIAGAPPCGAAGMPALVASALDSPPPRAEQRCAYTRTRIDGEHSKSERYHPQHAEAPWTLEQVNGRAPTEAERRRFARDAGAHDRPHPLAFDLRGMVVPGSWRLTHEDPRQAVFEFHLSPGGDVPERLADKAVGTLVVDKSGPRPEQVTIENTAPAYVAPLVRLAEYSQRLSFRWDDDLAAAVLSEIETRWRGRAFGLKVLRKHEVVRYSDYVCGQLKAG